MHALAMHAHFAHVYQYQILNTVKNGISCHWVNMLMKKMNVKLLDMCETSQLSYSIIICKHCNKKLR